MHGASSPASVDVLLTVQKGDLIGALIPMQFLHKQNCQFGCLSFPSELAD